MKKFSEILVGLMWAVLIITLAVTLALNMSFIYKKAIKKNNLVEETGLSQSEILDNYYVLIDYNNITGPDELEFPNFTMSEGGRIHFAEVKAIFGAIEWTLIIDGALTLILTYFMNRAGWFGYRRWGSMLTLVLPIIVGILAIFFWDTFFVKFHELFFDNDYWLFSVTEDPVITILPESFFKNSAIFIVELAIAGAVFLAYYYRKSLPPTEEEQEFIKKQEERQKKFDEEEAKRKDLKKGKRLGKHDFNLAEKANMKLKNK